MNTQAVVASIDRDITIKRRKIEQDLALGISKLAHIRVQEEKERQRALLEALSVLQAYAQAAVDAKEVWIYE